jgi:hypothetical protein
LTEEDGFSPELLDPGPLGDELLLGVRHLSSGVGQQHCEAGAGRVEAGEPVLPLTHAVGEVLPDAVVRFPRTSALIGAVGLVVLLVALAVTLSVAVEQITRIEVVAQHIGTSTSPVQLPLWAEIALPAAGALAATERALRLKGTWMAD